MMSQAAIQTVFNDVYMTSCITNHSDLNESINFAKTNVLNHSHTQAMLISNKNMQAKEKWLVAALKKIHSHAWPARKTESGVDWLYYHHSLSLLDHQSIISLLNEGHLNQSLLQACREFPFIAKIVMGTPEWNKHLPAEEIDATLTFFSRIRASIVLSAKSIFLHMFEGLLYLPLMHSLFSRTYVPLTQDTAKVAQVSKPQVSEHPDDYSTRFYNYPRRKKTLSARDFTVFIAFILPAAIIDVTLGFTLFALIGMMKGLVVGAINGWRRGTSKLETYDECLMDVEFMGIKPMRIIDIAHSVKENAILLQPSSEKKNPRPSTNDLSSTATIISKGIEADVTSQSHYEISIDSNKQVSANSNTVNESGRESLTLPSPPNDLIQPQNNGPFPSAA